MNHSLDALNAAHHFYELVHMLARLPSEDMDFLATAINNNGFSPKASEGVRHLLALLGERREGRATKRKGVAILDEFRFEDVMRRLRNAVMHSPNSASAAEVDWLLRIILTSPAVFASVREVDNFLSNMTGAEHDTKNTGRDRVVDWYFKHINSLPEDERNEVSLKIARNIFARGKSNYREWKDVLYGSSSK
jgi:hypothetical protein